MRASLTGLAAAALLALAGSSVYGQPWPCCPPCRADGCCCNSPFWLPSHCGCWYGPNYCFHPPCLPCQPFSGMVQVPKEFEKNQPPAYAVLPGMNPQGGYGPGGVQPPGGYGPGVYGLGGPHPLPPGQQPLPGVSPYAGLPPGVQPPGGLQGLPGLQPAPGLAPLPGLQPLAGPLQPLQPLQPVAGMQPPPPPPPQCGPPGFWVHPFAHGPRDFFMYGQQYNE
jgi:hypothetical protein